MHHNSLIKAHVSRIALRYSCCSKNRLHALASFMETFWFDFPKTSGVASGLSTMIQRTVAV